MPNFRKSSRFDENELPPLNEYPDWTKKDTKVIKVKLNGQPYDVVFKSLRKQYQIVEELIFGPKAEKADLAILRVRK